MTKSARRQKNKVSVEQIDVAALPKGHPLRELFDNSLVQDFDSFERDHAGWLQNFDRKEPLYALPEEVLTAYAEKRPRQRASRAGVPCCRATKKAQKAH